ncbi:MAG TPA: histidine ammonia-lyase [Candidatus Limnocylindrales bacterium]|nr:histidine ammonia-lyase [Candidatus Limnocylindrales bacterium]
MSQLRLTGHELTLEQLEDVARGGRDAVLDEGARSRMLASRAVIDEVVAANQVVYGVTTGFGYLASELIGTADAERLQANLLVSHAVGVGPAHEAPVVRAMLLLRANTLARGDSGCRPVLVERLLDLLRLNIHPVVPEQGSVGASGDLAPLAHLALPLIGRGAVEVDGKQLPAMDALRRHGLEPLVLQSKEGLALLNGTQQMTAVGALALIDAERALGAATVTAAMTNEALLGTDVAYAAAYQEARPHHGQLRVAAQLRHLLRDSQLQQAHHPLAHRVQDPYSVRCVPQVHGAVADALVYVRRVLEIEVNSATDNPLVFPEGGVDPSVMATGGGRVVSGGNFHGAPVALAMDMLAIALTDLAAMSERRIAQLVDARSSGLPAFLVENAGLNSGLMLLQYAAAALVSECKVLAHPASVDTIPTSANQEDHVSMGPIAARQARDVVRNVERVVAMELLCAAQGLDFRAREGPPPGQGVVAAQQVVRGRVPHLAEDRDPGPDIAAAIELVTTGALLDLLPADDSLRAGS